MKIGTPAAPNLYTGTIRELQGTEIVTRLRDADGKRVDLRIALDVDQTTSTVRGTMEATRGESRSSDEGSE